jgi:hypothetical protein
MRPWAVAGSGAQKLHSAIILQSVVVGEKGSTMSSLEDRALAASAKLARERAQVAAEEAARQAAYDREVERSKGQILEFIDLARRYNAPMHDFYKHMVRYTQRFYRDYDGFSCGEGVRHSTFSKLPRVWVLSACVSGKHGYAVNTAGCLYNVGESVDGKLCTVELSKTDKGKHVAHHPIPEEVILVAAQNVVGGIDPFQNYD